MIQEKSSILIKDKVTEVEWEYSSGDIRLNKIEVGGNSYRASSLPASIHSLIYRLCWSYYISLKYFLLREKKKRNIKS